MPNINAINFAANAGLEPRFSWPQWKRGLRAEGIRHHNRDETWDIKLFFCWKEKKNLLKEFSTVDQSRARSKVGAMQR